MKSYDSDMAKEATREYKFTATALTVIIFIYTFRSLENIIFASGISSGLSLMLDGMSILGYFLLFPVINHVKAPVWAKTAGYVWLIMDITATVMPLYGVQPEIYNSLRLGGAHMATAVWIAGVSKQHKGAVGILGIPLAVFLVAYSFLQLFFPAVLLEYFFGFLIIWFILLLYRIIEQKS